MSGTACLGHGQQVVSDVVDRDLERVLVTQDDHRHRVTHEIMSTPAASAMRAPAS